MKPRPTEKEKIIPISVIVVVILGLILSILTQPFASQEDTLPNDAGAQAAAVSEQAQGEGEEWIAPETAKAQPKGINLTGGLAWIGQILVSFIALLSSIGELTGVKVSGLFASGKARTNVEEFPFHVIQDHDALLDYLFPEPKTTLISDCKIPYLIYPDKDAYYISCGDAYYSLDDYQRALDDYAEAIRLAPGDAYHYRDRAWAYEALGQYDLALADFNEAVRLAPEDEDFYRSRGIFFAGQDELKKAIADFSETIRLDPRYIDVYIRRAGAYRNAGDYDNAQKDYNEAIRINPDYAYAYAVRASYYFDFGEYQKAIADCTQAIRIDPDYAWPYYMRAESYQALGREAEAAADYKKYEELTQ